MFRIGVFIWVGMPLFRASVFSMLRGKILFLLIYVLLGGGLSLPSLFLTEFSFGISLKGQQLALVKENITSFRSYNTDAHLVDVGEGNLVAVWKSARKGLGYSNIYIQKLMPDGTTLWEADGVPVTPLPYNQDHFQAVHDGFGGVIVVWEDSREGSDKKKVFIQRVNLRGELLWGNEGIPVCGGGGNQVNPRLISDGKNGFYIAWEDSRQGDNERDIYAQHINLAGRVNWMKDGLPICTHPGLQKNISLCPDGQHGLIMMWEDFRNGRYWNLYAQKLNRSGDYAWATGGLDIFAGREENHHNPDMVSDGYGGFIFVYQKFSEETRGYDVFRGRVQTGGELAYHFSTCHSQEDQIKPRIVKKGSDALICWEDFRNGPKDIYAQMIRINDGIFRWEQNGKPVVKSAEDDLDPHIVTSLSSNDQIFTWEKRGKTKGTIYAQKLDNFGEPVWDEAGIELGSSGGDQQLHFTLPDENGGLYSAWSDYSEQNSAFVRVQKLIFNGRRKWGNEGTKLAGVHNSPYASIQGTVILTAKNGAFFLAWEDFRNGTNNPDIYIQKMDEKGNPLWRNSGIPVCTAPGEQRAAVLVEDGVGGVIVVWTDKRNFEDDNIYSQRVSGSGKLLWVPEGVTVCAAPRSQMQVQAVTDTKEGVVICWADARDLLTNSFDLYTQRINYLGEVLWGRNGKPFANFAGLQTAPSMVTDGEGGAFIAWMDNRTGLSNIWLQHINSYGIYEWEYGGRRPHPAEYHQRYPKLTRNFRGDLYLAWEADITGDSREQVRVNCLTPNGYTLWSRNGLAVSLSPGRQTQPNIFTAQDGMLWVTWLDERAFTYAGVKMYGQKYSVDGNPLWEENGISIGKQMKEYNDFSVILNPGGYTYYFWNANTDGLGQSVYYQKVRPDGNKVINFEGAKVSETTAEQLYPVMAINKDSRVLVVWVEKEKNGEIKLIGAFIKEKF